MGVGFDLLTDAEKGARVLSVLKTLRVGVNEVATEIGGLVGAKGPQCQPHEIREAGGPGFGGKRVQ
jgi:hypothetical protein